jgi:hypothetical protein
LPTSPASPSRPARACTNGPEPDPLHDPLDPHPGPREPHRPSSLR